MDERIVDLQRRHAHQEELLRKLDEALREQGRRLDAIAAQVALLIQHLRTLEPSDADGEEPPPPHY